MHRYGKVVDFLHYSGRYTDHSGVSVHDLQRAAKERYAINAVSASAGPAPPSAYAEPCTYLSAACNRDICKVCVQCAQAHFSAANFEQSKIMATRALQGLALHPAAAGVAGGPSYGQSKSQSSSSNAFDSCHAAVPSIPQKLSAARGGGLVSVGAAPVLGAPSVDRTYEEALALVRFFAAREHRSG